MQNNIIARIFYSTNIFTDELCVLNESGQFGSCKKVYILRKVSSKQNTMVFILLFLTLKVMSTDDANSTINVMLFLFTLSGCNICEATLLLIFLIQFFQTCYTKQHTRYIVQFFPSICILYGFLVVICKYIIIKQV